MKIILLQDVSKVGRKFEVKELADGFARNFIIARGLGLLADQKNLARVEKLKKQQITEVALQQDLLEKTLADLAGATLTISRKANPEGHLFAAVHVEDVAAALRTQFHLDLNPKMIHLPEPLKTVGQHQVEIKNPAGNGGAITVEIVGEA